jgi:hypothetical protein
MKKIYKYYEKIIQGIDIEKNTSKLLLLYTQLFQENNKIKNDLAIIAVQNVNNIERIKELEKQQGEFTPKAYLVPKKIAIKLMKNK